MKTIFENLKSYFQNTSKDQIERDWADTEKYDNVGPEIGEFIRQSIFFYEVEKRNTYWEFSCQHEIIENPKFASDFFLF
ncbi:hypothetical protein [Elizabethkingia anophelis]|uniref:hypothetical protein n=1 Tax=Elizabethkingia anophelis TaxID=1117645 RepID=UPI0009999C48|nr:hypothetical protein [Elizabethkingia anophelis]MCT3721324.1 hypothetical protein [Elizabethkingia anophelis]MCT3724835.1 hypothetical protein [Elizabethkingia anophelis]MCT3756771.1 hypothetical protein [Elizabethkingia anophelis]MCT3777757.1 hypothetical protein [Elizabethkingia anophelis]MCT3784871.1 hypothetical protein [Elizabethkingia anophelis]